MKRMGMCRGTMSAATIMLALALCCGCNGDKTDNGGTAAPVQQSASDLGKAALDSEEWSRAYDSFTDAINANAADADAYFGRAAASCEIAKGHYRLAQAAAINKDVKTGEAEAKKADEHFAKTIEDCDKAIENDANYADAHYLKGVVAQYQGAWENGVAAFSEAIRLAPERADAYHRRGEIYSNIGDYMNAEVDFKKASELGYVDASSAENAPLDDFSDLKYDVEEETKEDAEAEKSQEENATEK